jgi:hypothetical protein
LIVFRRQLQKDLGFVTETGGGQTKTAPEGAVQIKEISLLQGNRQWGLAATEVVVQANLDGIDFKVMVEAKGIASVKIIWVDSVIIPLHQ